jgi:hypothetical protein
MSLASKAGLSSGFYMQIHASSDFDIYLSIALQTFSWTLTAFSVS